MKKEAKQRVEERFCWAIRCEKHFNNYVCFHFYSHGMNLLTHPKLFYLHEMRKTRSEKSRNNFLSQGKH